MVAIANLDSLDVRDNPEALKNTRTMEMVFIGGKTLAEMKEELKSNFQDISLTASVHRADLLEARVNKMQSSRVRGGILIHFSLF